uniref:Uncharacterized protein n=1 Tax=Cacopsylla melanoneura TaxID=428564 RepID=A0A8D8S9B3_9HEMI
MVPIMFLSLGSIVFSSLVAIVFSSLVPIVFSSLDPIVFSSLDSIVFSSLVLKVFSFVLLYVKLFPLISLSPCLPFSDALSLTKLPTFPYVFFLLLPLFSSPTSFGLHGALVISFVTLSV